MLQFAWYSPEIDVIVLQTFMEDCEISFEWSPQDIHRVSAEFADVTGVENFLWIPLGEI